MWKKKIISGIMVLIILIFCGCRAESEQNTNLGKMNTEETNTEEAKIEETSCATKELVDVFTLKETREYYEEMYKGILDYHYELIAGGMDNFDYAEGTTGIGETVRNDGSNAMKTIGYTFVDSNSDGEAELVIGSVNEENGGKYYGELIFATYACKDAPVLILEGWSRNRCYLLNDGTYFIESSNGVMHSAFENKQLRKNGTELISNDFYFTCENDKNYEEMEFYHNSTGEWDKSVSEEISEAEYTNSSIGYSSKILTLEFKPFSMYEYSGEVSENDNEEIEMHIEWADGNKVSDDTLPAFEADMNEPQAAVILSPNVDVYNFKVLSLVYENIDSTGNPVFSTTDLYQQEVLHGGTEFVIKFTMYGTIPGYGISYEDVYGTTYYYGLTESGMDGSPLLTEIMNAD